MAVDPIARFEADQAKILRGKVIAIVAALGLAGVFLAVALFGPAQQRRLNNPDGAMIMQVVGFAFVVGAFALGAWGFYRLGREAEARVEFRPEGLLIQTSGQSRAIRWQEIKSVFKANNAIPYATGGLLGALLFQTISGGQQQAIVLELYDGKRLAMPPFVSNAEALFDLVSRHVSHTAAS